MKTRGLLLWLFAAAMLFSACGDDETNPAGTGTPPTPSALSASVNGNTVTLSWSQCPDADFADYTVFRSSGPGIAQNPSGAVIVAVISNSGTISAADQGLPWNSDWYYAVRTTDTESLVSWSNEVPVSVPDSGSAGNELSCYQVQGQSETSPYDGMQVRVTGIVTAGGGELYGGFAVLGDASGGAWSGLVLFGDQAASLSRGDSISVSGEVSEYYGMTELTYLEDIAVHETGHALPSPEILSTEAVNDEQWEGVVVSVSDAVVLSASQYSYEIDDGSGSCYLGNRGDYSEPSVGDTVSAAGPLFYEFDQWRIQPRDDQDVSGSGGGGGGGVLSCYQVQGQTGSSPYEGQTVSVTGIVTVGGNEYYASGGSQYAVIQDQGGAEWSGLVIFGYDGVLDDLARGDSVVISGEVEEYYGLTEITGPEVVLRDPGHPVPQPSSISTGDLSQEKWEGVLCRVSDVEVADPDLGYGEFTVDDGSGECVVDDLGIYGFTVGQGQQFSSIVGAVWYSFSSFKLEPRDLDDITE
jgi:predicted extracellular nuclease